MFRLLVNLLPMKLLALKLLLCTAWLLFTAAESFAEDCGRLGNFDCRHSTECTLSCVRGSRPYVCEHYRCEPKLDACEKGLAQEDLTKEICEQRSGCKFNPGGCYCHCVSEADDPQAKKAGIVPCNCACAHGPLRQCVYGSAGR